MTEPETTEPYIPADLTSRPPHPQKARKISNYWLIAAITLVPVVFIAFWAGPRLVSRAVLANHKAQWDAAHIAHYQIVVDGYGYDAMPWTIEVQNDRVVSVIDAQDTPVDKSEYEDAARLTVNALFADIEYRFENNAPRVKVSYDPTYGYPVDMNISPWHHPCCQDYKVKILIFQVLPE